MLKKIQILCAFICTLIITNYANSSEINPGRSMQDNKLTVFIQKPIQEVFEFSTNPHNTPKWIDSISEEKTNEWPPKVGTIYKNRNHNGPWATYKVTKYEKNKEFELVKEDESTYHVNYNYFTSANGETKLVYHEWVTKGNLDGPFSQDMLNKLQMVMIGN